MRIFSCLGVLATPRRTLQPDFRELCIPKGPSLSFFLFRSLANPPCERLASVLFVLNQIDLRLVGLHEAAHLHPALLEVAEDGDHAGVEGALARLEYFGLRGLDDMPWLSPA